MGYFRVIFLVLVGLNVLLVASTLAADESAQQKGWTDEYQYGAKEKAPKTGEPEENGEFEIAPKE